MQPRTMIKIRLMDMVGFSMAFAVMAVAIGVLYAFEAHMV